jgi:hypothetical protein
MFKELGIADLSLSNRKTQLLHATFILESKITPDLTTKETQPEPRKSPEGLRRKEKKKETKSWKDRKTKKERSKRTTEKGREKGKGKVIAKGRRLRKLFEKIILLKLPRPKYPGES